MSIKIQRAAIEAAAKKYVATDLPEEYRSELGKEVVNCALSAFETKKPCNKAFTSKAANTRIEMKAEVAKTPNATLPDRIRFQLYILPNTEPVYFP